MSVDDPFDAGHICWRTPSKPTWGQRQEAKGWKHTKVCPKRKLPSISLVIRSALPISPHSCPFFPTWSWSRRLSLYMYYIESSIEDIYSTVQKVYLNATNGSRSLEITKEEFLYSAQMMSQITPLEIDVLFVLCDLLHQVPAFHLLPPHICAVRVFQVLSDREGAIQRFRWDHPRAIHETGWRFEISKWVNLILMSQVTKKIMEVKAVSTPEERSSFMAILESLYRCASCLFDLLLVQAWAATGTSLPFKATIDVRFALGSVAGAAGATAVYPIDLVWFIITSSSWCRHP